ncbi:MAG TPA: hypothetical protein VIJ14_05775, partial [Rhabdochlamydiaceae bacterium]
MSLSVDQISQSGSIGSARQGPVEPSKIDLIRDRVLQIIRACMPVETLFTPELKIDLGLFIKDQMLFHRIAEFMAPLVGTEGIDNALVETHFKGSDLLSEIKPEHLSAFYAACKDVLNKAPFSNKLRPAIEGRIFTLKNALIAQHSPEVILKSQTQHKFAVQDVKSIQEEGITFIREALRLHLSSLKKSQSFQKELTATAEQLIPFVQKITRNYLLERGKNCPENPLIWRNPTGYNAHGLVAATVMEACLNALGYTTKILERCDLEPKVTLATQHGIIMVIGPDNLRYVVDPSYCQFHQDVCLDVQLPTSPVLVLEESAVDAYIEKNIMAGWRTTFKTVQANNVRIIDQLHANDRLLSFFVDRIGLPKEYTPVNLEDWVRKSFKKLWGFSSYYPIDANEGFQEIFHGLGTKQVTYNAIKSMGIAALTYHLSDADLEKRLDLLLRDPALKGQNSLEVMSLLGQLPKLKRMRYATLLDCDPRLQENAALEISLNAYFRSLKRVVNPEGKDLKVIYGCSGSDCTTVFLATDATDFTFVDLTPVTFAEFGQALESYKPKKPSFELAIHQKFKKESYISFRSRWGAGI